ncbi:MAG: LapA family protein [Thiotrichales bacterium]|nr:LapA family protein [Thiotrichales bacterium]
MYRIVLIVVVLLVFIPGLIFHLQNDHLVAFNYYIGSVEYHFSVFMVLSFIAGAIIGVCAMMAMVVQLQNRIRKLSKQMRLRDKEVSNLRSIPYREPH